MTPYALRGRPISGMSGSTRRSVRRRLDLGGSSTADIVGSDAIENPQYPENIYHNKTSFGSREKKTLQKLYNERQKDAVVQAQQFQSYRIDGFPTGVGSFRLACATFPLGGNPTQVFLPVFCFRLNVPQFNSVLSEAGVAYTNACTPVAYQLVRTPIPGGSALYSWSLTTTGGTNALSATQFVQNNNFGANHGVAQGYNRYYPGTLPGTSENIARSTGGIGAAEGTGMKISRYQHNYSDIAMTFYSRELIPGSIETSIVRFNKDFGPESTVDAWSAASVLTNITYNVSTPDPADIQADNAAWDHYLDRRISHPNAMLGGNVGNRDQPRLPFIPIRRETIDIPSSTNTPGGVRMIKKVFYRSDKYYDCAVNQAAATAQGTNGLTDDGIEGLVAGVNPGFISSRGSSSGVYPSDDKVEYLLVTCNDFRVKAVSTLGDLKTELARPSEDISFDIFMKSKMTYLQAFPGSL